jgi:2,4-diaminopentanoate dehydrogenase
MIRLAQLYTGSVGSEIVRRLAGHRALELVAVLVHSSDKAKKDSGTLVGAEANGIVTTLSVDEVLAARPDAAIYSGTDWEPDLFATLLRAGVNVYTGRGVFYPRGTPEFDLLDAAGREGNASFTAGGNIPGLITDAFPLFVCGYTGRIRAIRAWQRNDVSAYPSAVQIQMGLGIGNSPDAPQNLAADAHWVASMRQPANLVADALGVELTDFVLADKQVALAKEDLVLEGSGLLVEAGTVGGVRWTFAAYSGDQPFFTFSNEQTATLGLGPGWRESYEQPPWRVEIDGEPPIVATFGWPTGVAPGHATSLLNVARAMNTIPPLVAAHPGFVSILDFPPVVAGDGLAAL